MNMSGVIVAEPERVRRSPLTLRAVQKWIRARRMFLLMVALPVALVSVYYFLIASDQYESEAHFIVRTTSQAPIPGSGISQAISAATGLSAAQSESLSVADYLTSHDVVATLQRQIGLIARFTRPGVDLISRLGSTDPTPERLLNYYRDMVDVTYNTETGITIMKVRGFTPADSATLAERLLELGEARVNMLNTRGYRDAVTQAQSQLSDTEDALEKVQGRLTHFRQQHRDIDPQASGEAQIGLVSKMSADLSAARAQLTAVGNSINHSSPQYVALAARVRALEQQMASQSGRLTGSGSAIAADVSGYEDLRMRQQFLAKRYDAASASLDKAREQAQRQQLYVIRVVEPNMPVKSTYPKRFRIVFTVLLGLLLLYGITWLIAAGVKEHAA